MKKIIQITLYFSAFLLTGEFVFRVESSLVKHEVLDVRNNNSEYSLSSEGSNILLLGDSFTKGLGITENDRIANQLRDKGLGVIDSSTSGDNWVDYYRKILQFQQMDTVDFIVIGVNWNDVGFPTGSLVNYTKNLEILPPGELKHKNTKKGIARIIPNIYASKLASTLSSYFQNELKRAGFPLPVGNFHYFRTEAYKEHSKDFEVIYSKFSELTSVYDLKIILYLMPDFNLLNRPEYFKTFSDEFSFHRSNVYVINGLDSFKGNKDGEYCISIHDGHPNAVASKKIALDISLLISQISSEF